MSQPSIIVYSSTDVEDVPMLSNNQTFTGTNQFDGYVGFYGTTPIAQPSGVNDPSGGATVDAEARAAILSIKDALVSLGLIGTAVSASPSISPSVSPSGSPSISPSVSPSASPSISPSPA